MSPRHTPESLRAHSAATLKLAESHLHASGEAYRKRSSIQGVTLDQATHDALAEAFQAWREYRVDTAPPGCDDLYVPERQADGSAPALTRVHGYDVTIGDVDGIAWDTGPEPLIPFEFGEFAPMSMPHEPQDPLLVQLHDARLDRQDAATRLARQDAQAEDARAGVVHLIRHLYVDLDQSMGGPLHVQIDDGNLGDHWVSEESELGRYDYLFNGDFETYAQAGDDVSLERRTAIRDTCKQILALLRPMSEQQRRDAINEFWKGWRP